MAEPLTGIRPFNTQLTKDFHIREFKCKDGTEVPFELIDNVTLLAFNLQILRDYIGEPIHITSAYRTPLYNQKIGGKPKSEHLTAKASDVTVKSKTPKQLAAIVEKLIAQKKLWFGGIGIYKGFLHLDIRSKPTRWVG